MPRAGHTRKRFREIECPEVLDVLFGVDRVHRDVCLCQHFDVHACVASGLYSTVRVAYFKGNQQPYALKRYDKEEMGRKYTNSKDLKWRMRQIALVHPPM